MGFVVLAYAMYWAGQHQGRDVGNKAAFLWQKFPKFVLGFLLISLLASLSVFSKDQIGSLANLSRWAFLLTFAGVGLRINFREMKKQGLRPFIVGALGEIVIAAITLGLVLGASKLVSTPGAESYAEALFSQMHYGVGADLAARCLWLLAVAVLGAGLVGWRAWGNRDESRSQEPT